MHLNTVFETARLTLRPFTMQDVPYLHQLLGDPEVMQYSTCGVQPYETVLGDVRHNLEVRFPGMLPFGERMIVARDSGTVVGWCGLNVCAAVEDGVPEITYNTLPPYWGRGYATEAASAMRDHAFGDLHCAKLIAVIHSENRASIRVAEKIGLRYAKPLGRANLYAMSHQEFQSEDRLDVP